MTLSYIHDFQKTIYVSLLSERALTDLINKIYIGPPLSPKAPYISMRIIELEDLSKFSQKLYNIDFIISIYVQEKDYHQLANIADLIINNIAKIINISLTCKIIGVQASKVNFANGRDLAVHKADIYFKSSIAQR